jgi:1,4-alpha-glucan branching enzyme
MSRFHAYSRFTNPGLHLWREGTNTRLYLEPSSNQPEPGWVEFDYDFEPHIQQDVCFMLFDHTPRGNPGEFEKPEHQRKLPRRPDGNHPNAVWFVQGSGRVLEFDPRADTRTRLEVHLISRSRFRPSRLFLWNTVTNQSRRVELENEDHLGPVFDLALEDQERSFFTFKFIRKNPDTGGLDIFEPDYANRLWTARDGAAIWTHSEAAEITGAEPEKKTLRIHFRQELASPPKLHFWQHNSDFDDHAEPCGNANGWLVFQVSLYTRLNYGVQFWNPALPEATRWEHPEAARAIRIEADQQIWTLEGDRKFFFQEPQRNIPIQLMVGGKAPSCRLDGPLLLHVWINRARAPILDALPVSLEGEAVFSTYPGLITSMKFRDQQGRWETMERHPLPPAEADEQIRRFVVLGRGPLLPSPPPAHLFQDPPFFMRRPGAYEEDGHIHFVVHAPGAARIDLTAEWLGSHSLPLKSTLDESYWWARIPKQQLLDDLGADNYHGARYRFLLNENQFLQDPAAGWMDSSWNEGFSRLVQSDAFPWNDSQWQRPGWEYLTVYQLHPSRFSNRFQEEPPLKRLAREIDSDAGYLRHLGITALLMLPLNEVGSQNSWGYDPAFYYGIENDYGGPDALKELVNTCHQNGLAVILDVVFNHAGSIDNILWAIARESFFDGDTAWGAMINFDHPQSRHFFAQNLVYLAKEFHIDGFRLDHTGTIVHSHASNFWSGSVREPGSGGGWEFLQGLRAAVHREVDSRCILMAEHLPNEWALTNYGGPMDTQWCDDFHDRLVDACRGLFVMPKLAAAFKLSHEVCDDWYQVTNYPESHDEVGNVNDRISNVAGWKRGLRMSKVAATATLLSRGIPMYFMGAESGEHEQFHFGRHTVLDLNHYLADPEKAAVRSWWRELSFLRKNPSIQGPSPLKVHYASGQLLAFSRGANADFFVLLNFGGWAGHKPLWELNLPHGSYRELWNSTWPAFAVPSENEDEHTNGGGHARLNRSHWLHIPDYGTVVLEKTN